MLKLGPLDSPLAEFMPWDIYPVIAVMIELNPPLSPNDLDSVWTFLQLDTSFLDEESLSFFLKLEDACKRILAGEVAGYDADAIRQSEFAGYLDHGAKDGVVTPGVKAAAQRFLDLLAANPDYWPLVSTP